MSLAIVRVGAAGEAGAPIEIMVDSKKFTESVILGEMLRHLAELPGHRASHQRAFNCLTRMYVGWTMIWRTGGWPQEHCTSQTSMPRMRRLPTITYAHSETTSTTFRPTMRLSSTGPISRNVHRRWWRCFSIACCPSCATQHLCRSKRHPAGHSRVR
jgi:hypothetical protein